eukprot:5819203-Amphidinium_carterae.1
MQVVHEQGDESKNKTAEKHNVGMLLASEGSELSARGVIWVRIDDKCRLNPPNIIAAYVIAGLSIHDKVVIAHSQSFGRVKRFQAAQNEEAESLTYINMIEDLWWAAVDCLQCAACVRRILPSLRSSNSMFLLLSLNIVLEWKDENGLASRTQPSKMGHPPAKMQVLKCSLLQLHFVGTSCVFGYLLRQAGHQGLVTFEATCGPKGTHLGETSHRLCQLNESQHYDMQLAISQSRKHVGNWSFPYSQNLVESTTQNSSSGHIAHHRSFALVSSSKRRICAH